MQPRSEASIPLKLIGSTALSLLEQKQRMQIPADQHTVYGRTHCKHRVGPGMQSFEALAAPR